MPPLPSGLYFGRYHSAVQCPLCHTPFWEPVELRPCGHVFCMSCIVGCRASQCPQCRAPTIQMVHPTLPFCDLVRELPVHCSHCNFSGNRDVALHHMCRGRQRFLCIQAITRCEDDPSAWFGLAAALKPDEVDECNGQKVTKAACYCRSLCLNPQQPSTWCNLGVALRTAESVTVSSVRMSKTDCFVKAIALDPECITAWFNLGNSLRNGEHRDVNGRRVFRNTCYLRAVEINERFAAAWYNLGMTLEPGFAVDYHGNKLSQKDCFIRTVAANPAFPAAWNSLGKVVSKAVKLADGRRLAKKDCFITAVRLKSDFKEAWYNLGNCMKPDELVIIDEVQYTKSQCFANGKSDDAVAIVDGTASESNSEKSGGSSARSAKPKCAVS